MKWVCRHFVAVWLLFDAVSTCRISIIIWRWLIFTLVHLLYLSSVCARYLRANIKQWAYNKSDFTNQRFPISSHFLRVSTVSRSSRVSIIIHTDIWHFKFVTKVFVKISENPNNICNIWRNTPILLQRYSAICGVSGGRKPFVDWDRQST